MTKGEYETAKNKAYRFSLDRIVSGTIASSMKAGRQGSNNSNNGHNKKEKRKSALISMEVPTNRTTAKYAASMFDVGTSLDGEAGAESELQRAKRLMKYPKAKQERQKKTQQNMQEDHPANIITVSSKSKAKRGLRKNKAGEADVGTPNSTTIRDNQPISAISGAPVSRERKSFPDEKFRPSRAEEGADQVVGTDLESVGLAVHTETSPECIIVPPMELGSLSAATTNPTITTTTTTTPAQPALEHPPQNPWDDIDIERQDRHPPEDSPHMVEATLVTENSAINVASDVPISEAEIVTEKSIWYNCTPKSAKGRLFCAVAFLAVLGIAVTGIVCGTGACSASGDVDPDAPVRYDPKFISLPEYTIAALRDPYSSQAKAYRWLANSAGQYDLASKPEWRKHQLFGMATLYHSVGGDSWSNRKGWLDATFHECDWGQNNQIGCDGPIYGCIGPFGGPCGGSRAEAREVISLRLSGFRLGSATIPKEIELLSSLQRLDIYASSQATDLVDVLPTEIASLQALTQLSLVGPSFISGGVPSFIGSLSSLTFLALARNRLEGTVPPEIGLLSNLQQLILSSNKLRGLPSQIGLLSNLRFLDLSSNNLAGFPTYLGLLSNLKELDLSFNYFTGLPSERGFGVLPSEIGLLSGLSWFNLSSSKMRSLPSQMGLLSNLEMLDLSSNNLVGLPTELGLLSNLNDNSLVV